jgi:hypothetical protein
MTEALVRSAIPLGSALLAILIVSWWLALFLAPAVSSLLEMAERVADGGSL